MYRYRVTHLDGENLPLTLFRQFWQLLGPYNGYLLPSQDGGAMQISQREVFTLQMGLQVISR